MAVAKDFGEGGRRVAAEMPPSFHDMVFVIGEDGVAGLHNLHPFGLWSQDNAGLLEEIGFFLYSTRIGHDKLGMTLQGNYLQEGNRRDEANVMRSEKLFLQFFLEVGFQEFVCPWVQWQYDLTCFGKM